MFTKFTNRLWHRQSAAHPDSLLSSDENASPNASYKNGGLASFANNGRFDWSEYDKMLAFVVKDVAL